jgi:hypothetical protein
LNVFRVYLKPEIWASAWALAFIAYARHRSFAALGVALSLALAAALAARCYLDLEASLEDRKAEGRSQGPDAPRLRPPREGEDDRLDRQDARPRRVRDRAYRQQSGRSGGDPRPRLGG